MTTPNHPTARNTVNSTNAHQTPLVASNSPTPSEVELFVICEAGFQEFARTYSEFKSSFPERRIPEIERALPGLKKSIHDYRLYLDGIAEVPVLRRDG